MSFLQKVAAFQGDLDTDGFLHFLLSPQLRDSHRSDIQLQCFTVLSELVIFD
mgnify:FL=1